ncbi:MAG: PEP-CTERM sorting domain-containing protein [Planctomycetota bacterium]
MRYAIAMGLTTAMTAGLGHAAFIITDPDTTGGISPDAAITDEYGNTSATDFAALPGLTVVSFDVADNTGGDNNVPGTVTVTGEYTATLTRDNIQFAVLGNDSLGAKMTSDGGYLATRNAANANPGVITIDIDGVDAIGFTVNDFAFGGTVTVFSGTDVLDTDTIVDGIGFYGYTRDTGEGQITSVEIELNSAPFNGGFVGFQVGIDDLAVVATIPEPGALGFLGLGALALVARRR